ncbi:Gfo/Idh/MocA family oxidoreductase [Streptomyces olivaceoviridis]|uniref:Gfo/Idh/MocA family oxidoreductase n=1 Tax=Streptomyces olivaceoviridis TaxID=1921 RepID=UPI0033A2E4EA
MGDVRRTHLTTYGVDGVSASTVRYDQDLFRDAYVAELADFAEMVRTGRASAVTGADARAALSVALAAVESVQSGGPVRIADLEGR